MNIKKIGTLYGVGAGPGDPELITLKSVKILSKVDIVFAAASTKNAYSLAVNIAKPHIPKTTPIKMLSFPMTRDESETKRAWKKHAKTIITELEQGKNVAFLTLGDPMTYSTYGYILKWVQALSPHAPMIKTSPGIASYQAASARLNIPLVEGEEMLLIVSGAKGGDCFRRLTNKPENVVFLKAYKNVKDINSALKESGMFENSVGIKNCGLAEEEVIQQIDKLNGSQPDYWTLVIAKRKSPKS